MPTESRETARELFEITDQDGRENRRTSERLLGE
jgi:hypothetical protein